MITRQEFMNQEFTNHFSLCDIEPFCFLFKDTLQQNDNQIIKLTSITYKRKQIVTVMVINQKGQ